MGLSGRKQKQRISADPRNLSWADDASRFGHSYLSKFGWDVSKGLGSSGDGIKSHIKVQQKLDMMGIGAQHQRDPDGIAWKQNKDFEALLKRLNESTEQDRGADVEDTEREGGRETAMTNTFVCPQEKVEEKLGSDPSVTTKKRKCKDQDDPDISGNTRKKKHQKSSSDDSAAPAADCTSVPSLAPPLTGSRPESTPKPRPMAHRARIRAAKRIAGKPASAISEILGIAPSSSVSTSMSAPTSTPPSTLTPRLVVSHDNLTTSAKSVTDYFKEKLLARPSSLLASSSSSLATAILSESATPGLGATRMGLGLPNILSSYDDCNAPRTGIGSQVPAVVTNGQDMLTEKQRRKAERKAEKRTRRGAKAGQATPEGISDSKERVEEDDAEGVQRMSKKHEKQNKRRERERQAPVDQPDDEVGDIIEQNYKGDDALSGSSRKPGHQSKKDHKKKRS